MPSDLTGLTRRPIAATDAATLADLLNAIEVVDVFGEYYSVEDAADQINAPLLDLERGTVGVFDGDVMVGYSSAAHKPLAEGTHRVALSGGVHPDYRRRGLGSELLATGIASARTLHAIHHPALTLAVDVQNNARNDGALACYRAAGMTPLRWYSHMRHPLGAATVDIPTPEGFVLDTYTADTDPEFFAVSNEAYLERRGGVPMPLEQWRGLLGWQAFRPDLSFLMREAHGGEPVGVLLTFSWDADTKATGIRDAHFLRIGTRPACRRRGVAGALIGHAVSHARDQGYDRASLEVAADSRAGANGLYERAGFTVARTEVSYTLNV
ncbi:Mycothiol acetyltransferase [Streptomyces sp. RB5]|uniref:Mycothiol acetyltransferase n=1 Tax=Streptomyces smaragdinus TaxID=2585196 RepID=A0A7K0CC05_9ACTN|nr:GNAT family N-acetyltransferase [Streptomyces smaragdinus]MQY10981.1 Mycothiol acetyltransferase [Streptomyces smaragdinus]